MKIKIGIISIFVVASFWLLWMYNQGPTSSSSPSSSPLDTTDTSVSIHTPTHKKPHKKSMVILALGDSLTYGYNLSQKDAFPKLVENQLNQEFPTYQSQVINAGINGSTTGSAVSRLQQHINNHSRIHILLLALGANDGLRGMAVSSIQKNLQNTIDLALSKNMSVILAGMKAPPNYGLTYSDAFQNIYKTLAKKNNVNLIPFLLEGVAMKPSLNLPDGIHPNPSGHQIMAQTVFSHLRKFYND